MLSRLGMYQGSKEEHSKSFTFCLEVVPAFTKMLTDLSECTVHSLYVMPTPSVLFSQCYNQGKQLGRLGKIKKKEHLSRMRNSSRAHSKSLMQEASRFQKKAHLLSGILFWDNLNCWGLTSRHARSKASHSGSKPESGSLWFQRGRTSGLISPETGANQANCAHVGRDFSELKDGI